MFREIAENVQALPRQARRARPMARAGDAAVVRLDRLKVKEIVQNLVSNALKFTREGEVTVDVTGDAVAHDPRARHRTGIDPRRTRPSSTMFERVERDRTDRPPGVGLGLYIVRSLVALIGRRIAVERARSRYVLHRPDRPGLRLGSGAAE